MFGVWCAGTTLKVFDGLCVGIREVCLEKWRRRAPNWTIKQTVGTSMTSLAQQRVPNRVNSTPGEFWKSFFVSQAGRYDGGGDARRPVLR